MPFRHRLAVDRAKVGAGLGVFPPNGRGVVPEILSSPDDFIVGLAAGFPVALAEFGIGEFDSGREALGITGEGGLEKLEAFPHRDEAKRGSHQTVGDLSRARSGLVGTADVHDEGLGHGFQFVWCAALGGLEANLDFGLGGEGFPRFLIPFLVVGNEQLVGRGGLFKNAIEHVLDAALVELLHDLGGGDGGSLSVADHDQRGEIPVLAFWQRLFEVEPVEVPGVFGDFERLDHVRQSTAIRWVRPTRSR